MNFIDESKVIFEIDRPKTFMDDPHHCEECEEVEKNAQEADIDTLTLKQAGDGYASFHCFLNETGFIYYFPALIRLCIETTMDDGYLHNFIFAITNDGKDNRILKHCSNKQREFVCQFIQWYKENHNDLLIQWLVDDDEINLAMSLWSA